MFLNRIGDYIMARGKSSKLKPFEKLLTIMVSGKPVTVEEIDATNPDISHLVSDMA